MEQNSEFSPQLSLEKDVYGRTVLPSDFTQVNESLCTREGGFLEVNSCRTNSAIFEVIAGGGTPPVTQSNPDTYEDRGHALDLSSPDLAEQLQKLPVYSQGLHHGSGLSPYSHAFRDLLDGLSTTNRADSSGDTQITTRSSSEEHGTLSSEDGEGTVV